MIEFLIFFYFQIEFSDGSDVFKRISPRMEATHVMEVAQLLLSLIHSWGIDLHLDKVCETQLGLLRPMVSLFPPYTSFSNLERLIYSMRKTLNLFLNSDTGIIWCTIKRWLYVTIVTNMAK